MLKNQNGYLVFFLLPLIVCNSWETPQGRSPLREGEYTALKGGQCSRQASPGILGAASAAAQFSALAWHSLLRSLFLLVFQLLFPVPTIAVSSCVQIQLLFQHQAASDSLKWLQALVALCFLPASQTVQLQDMDRKVQLARCVQSRACPNRLLFWLSWTSYAFYFQTHQLFWLGRVLCGVL